MAWTTTATTRSTRGCSLDYDNDGFGGSSFTYEGCERSRATSRLRMTAMTRQRWSFLGLQRPVTANDCNGVTDVTSTYYLNSDGDGFGDAGFTVAACGLPAGCRFPRLRP